MSDKDVSDKAYGEAIAEAEELAERVKRAEYFSEFSIKERLFGALVFAYNVAIYSFLVCGIFIACFVVSVLVDKELDTLGLFLLITATAFYLAHLITGVRPLENAWWASILVQYRRIPKAQLFSTRLYRRVVLTIANSEYDDRFSLNLHCSFPDGAQSEMMVRFFAYCRDASQQNRFSIAFLEESLRKRLEEFSVRMEEARRRWEREALKEELKEEILGELRGDITLPDD